VAMTRAARASLRMLADDATAPRRRVVLAADVPDSHANPDGGFDEPTQVEVAVPVPLAWVVAGHVDDQIAMVDVADAVAALPAAEAGDADARFTVDGAEGHELLWYASQELPCLFE